MLGGRVSLADYARAVGKLVRAGSGHALGEFECEEVYLEAVGLPMNAGSWFLRPIASGVSEELALVRIRWTEKLLGLVPVMGLSRQSFRSPWRASS